MKPATPPPVLDDAALLAELARTRRKALPIVMALVVVIIPIGAGLGLWAISALGEADAERLIHIVVAAALGVTTLAMVLVQFSRKTDAKNARITRLNGESMQRMRLIALTLIGITLVLMAATVTAKTISQMHDGQVESVGWFMTVQYLYFCIWGLVVLLGRNLAPFLRRAMDDELTDLNRALAIRAGFFAFLAGAVGLFGAAQVNTQWAAVGLPGLVALPLVVAIFRLVWLERSAAKDG